MLGHWFYETPQTPTASRTAIRSSSRSLVSANQACAENFEAKNPPDPWAYEGWAAGGQKFQPHLHRVLLHPPGEATIKLEKSFNEKHAGISIKTIWYYTCIYIYTYIWNYNECIYIYTYIQLLLLITSSHYIIQLRLPKSEKIEYLRIEQITQFFSCEFVYKIPYDKKIL